MACKQPFLPGQQLRDPGAVAARHQRGREAHFALPVALGRQPGPLGLELIEKGFDDGETCPGFGLVEPDQQIAGLDPIAVGHLDLGDNAPVAALDSLGIALHHDHARGNDGAADRRHRRPGANAAEHDDEAHKAQDLVEA